MPCRFMLCIPNVVYTALLYHCQQSHYPCISIGPTQTASKAACQCQGLHFLLSLTSLIFKDLFNFFHCAIWLYTNLCHNCKSPGYTTFTLALALLNRFLFLSFQEMCFQENSVWALCFAPDSKTVTSVSTVFVTGPLMGQKTNVGEPHLTRWSTSLERALTEAKKWPIQINRSRIRNSPNLKPPI